ncbi:MAG TPA: phosphoribosylformylglycinamidine synthase subunit PurQ [Nitrososphaeraceae archaeon]|jgi:phosphoribosylformylglycinamidine synthase|nr:phosphoribosylformylglycinamidine synthase subunit PurQ [Nitrososphaeraceae archaeon]
MKKIGVIVFPGTNGDRDVFHVLSEVMHVETEYVWHNRQDLTGFSGLVLPGGFSYGDRLRAGVIAANSPVIHGVKRMAKENIPVLGICNGFQILIEAGILPGALVKNEHLSFVCRWVNAKIENERTPFTKLFKRNQRIRMPIAHGEGRYVADRRTIKELRQKEQIVLSYVNENPNGSFESIASICSPEGNVVGMMPHPERASERVLSSPAGGIDGSTIFQSLVRHLDDSM